MCQLAEHRQISSQEAVSEMRMKTLWITIAVSLLCVGETLSKANPSLFATSSQLKDLLWRSEKERDQDDPVVVTVNLQQSFNSISDRFVGVTLDMSSLRVNWGTLDFNSKKVQNLAKALTPCYFRFGGGDADACTYAMDQESDRSHPVSDEHGPFNMTRTQWLDLNQFLQGVGWDFIFDFNVQKRKADGTWDPENARQLLQFSADRNFTFAAFQLGNEYEWFPKNATLSPKQFANDTAALRQLLLEFPQYYSAFILGPETVNSAPQYFEAYLAAGGYKSVYAASSHHYYFVGHSGKLSYFTDIYIMDTFSLHLDDIIRQARAVDPRLPLWITETASASFGGMYKASDRFIAGFLWLDKLGLSAAKGIKAVIRQDFYRANYSLIDDNLNPNPDYWLTVLYKRIVRGAVFDVTSRQDVRSYAACANTDNFPLGSLAVYLLNPNNGSVTFDLPQFNNQPGLLYSLTAGDSDGLQSKFIALNGEKLLLVNDELPPLKPVSFPGGAIAVPAYSYTFLVFPDAQVSLCLV